jgi:hypothetical protein
MSYVHREDRPEFPLCTSHNFVGVIDYILGGIRFIFRRLGYRLQGCVHGISSGLGDEQHFCPYTKPNRDYGQQSDSKESAYYPT